MVRESKGGRSYSPYPDQPCHREADVVLSLLSMSTFDDNASACTGPLALSSIWWRAGQAQKYFRKTSGTPGALPVYLKVNQSEITFHFSHFSHFFVMFREMIFCLPQVIRPFPLLSSYPPHLCIISLLARTLLATFLHHPPRRARKWRTPPKTVASLPIW